MKKNLVLMFVCALALTTVAQATVTTLTQGVGGYTGCEDVWLSDSSVHYNFGATSGLYTQGDATGSVMRDTSAIKFDLSGVTVPAGETVQSAVLTMWVFENGWNTSWDIGLHRALYSFNYGTGDGTDYGWGAATMSYNSFNNLRWGNGTATSNFSGPVEGIDFSTTPDATTPVPTNVTAAVPMTIDVTSLVNYWLANPSSNFGVFLIPERDTGAGVGVWMRSADSNSEWNQRPSLTITTVVPEPATMIMLSLGSMFMLKRKMRRS